MTEMFSVKFRYLDITLIILITIPYLCSEVQKAHLHKLHIYYFLLINILQQVVHF